jgi:hypothetical protein
LCIAVTEHGWVGMVSPKPEAGAESRDSERFAM